MPSDYEKIREDNIKEYGEGKRHLAVLDRLYTDRTHFIFELLQNAEDAGASKILFKLFDDRLEVSHDGRCFDERDVKGVCGVGESTKAEDLTQIGKFGIGFKSVYAYTSTPEVHSGDEHFGIENYVRPYAVKHRNIEEPWSTLFVFRFNEVDPETACQEIGECLRNLSVRTLLFLRRIKEIEYQLPDDDGVYLRDEISRSHARQVTVIGQNNGQDQDEAWLIFERPVTVPAGSVEVPVEVGFQIETSAGNENIVRTARSTLVVSFPTEKETHLGFLVQGPYCTTTARDNITKKTARDNIPGGDEWNKTLIKETAELAVEALRRLKEMGLLSVSLLEVLPIRVEDFPESSMFYSIFSGVKKALLSEELLPADDGTFVAAPNAKLVRGAELTALLNQDQLRTLFQSADNIKWLTGEITENKTPELRSYLMNELGIDEVTPDRFASHLSENFFTKQSDEWFIKFYQFLSSQKALWRRPRWRGEKAGILRNKPMLRLQDGTHVTPFHSGSPRVYLATKTDIETSLPIVKLELSADEEARKFLQELGVPALDIVAEVIEEILPKYTGDSVTIDLEENERDLKKIERAYETDSAEEKNRLRDALCRTPFVLAECPNEGRRAYRKPGQIYFSSDELRMYFSGNVSFACVSHAYPQAGLLKELDVQESVRVQKKSRDPRDRGRVTLTSCHGWHERGLNGFDPAIHVDGLECALSTPTQEKSAFIWNEIAVPNSDCLRGVVEKSTRQTYENSTESMQISEKFGELLINTTWLPDSNGHMHKPDELTLDDLPESFVRDEKLADQLGMKKNVVAKLAEEVGVKQETIRLAKHLEENPEILETAKKLLTQKEETQKPAFPTRSADNPERRRVKVSEQYANAPEKEYETRKRSIRMTKNEIDPNTYLKNQYTNEDGQMICQICKEEMPFRKRDDAYYFEAVEVLSKEYLPNEHEAQFLALCPLCAAMYKEFVKRDEDAMKGLCDVLKASDKSEAPLTLGRLKTSLRFVETHWQDMQAILQRSEQSEVAIADDQGTWTEQDQEDLTMASLQYAETRYPEEDLV